MDGGLLTREKFWPITLEGTASTTMHFARRPARDASYLGTFLIQTAVIQKRHLTTTNAPERENLVD